MSTPRMNLSPKLTLVALVVAATILSQPSFAVEALSTADQNILPQKPNVKDIMQDIFIVASIVCVGCTAYSVLMERSTRVLVTAAVGLAVATIAGVVIKAM